MANGQAGFAVQEPRKRDWRAAWFVGVTLVAWFVLASAARFIAVCSPPTAGCLQQLQPAPRSLPVPPGAVLMSSSTERRDMVIFVVTLGISLWVSFVAFFPSTDD
jgi:hypothetical protein